LFTLFSLQLVALLLFVKLLLSLQMSLLLL
jgi:hypothetical protein